MQSIVTDKLQGKVIQKDNKKYSLNQILGQGQFGFIYQGLDLQTNQTVAIKVIPKVLLQKFKQLSYLIPNEIKSLQVCKSKNVLRYIDDYQTQNNFYIITEYCKDGDLHEYVTSRKRLDERTAIEFFCQILQGMKEIHRNKIAHRDIKAQNIFLHQGVLKLADFGFARMYNIPEDQTENANVFQTALGSPCYMAPEVLLCKPYSIKADIYSLGVLFYFMLFGKFPYYYPNLVEQNDSELAKQIQTKPLIIQTRDVKISKNAIDLLQKMILYDPSKRINFSELYKHPVVLSILQSDKLLGDGRNGLDIDIHKSQQEYQELELLNQFQNSINNDEIQLLDIPEDFQPVDNKHIQQINRNDQVLVEVQQFINRVCKQEINQLNFISKTIYTIAKYKDLTQETSEGLMFLSYYLMMYRICLKWKEINKGFFYEQTNIFKYQDFDRFKDNQTYLDFMNNVLNSYYSVIEAHINTEIDEFMLLVSSTDNSLIQMMISAQKVDQTYDQILNDFLQKFFQQQKKKVQNDKKNMKIVWRIGICSKMNKLFNNKDITQYLDEAKQEMNSQGWKKYLEQEINKIEQQ